MNRTLGPILRTSGILVEMVCLFFLFRLANDRRVFAGIPMRHLPMIGLAIGLSIWAAGIVLIMLARRR